MEFDTAGNNTTAILSDGDEKKTSIENKYDQTPNGKLRVASVISSGAEIDLKWARRSFVYNEDGVLTGSRFGSLGADVSSTYEYEAGKPLRATLVMGGENSVPQVLTFDPEGRLIERTTSAEKTHQLTVTWTGPREFEVHSINNEVKRLDGKGKLDEHGSLLDWRWQGLFREPRLVELHNDITYDEHGNWTKLISTVVSPPDEPKPSNPILVRVTRTITYH